MGSLKSWTSDRFEAVNDDKQEGGSSRHYLTDFDAAAAAADDDDNKPLENSDQPTTFRVSIASSSTELLSENHMPAAAQVIPQGYVPNRIPSSVFSGIPATATDWSTASNESLFSIHIANGSYSKEQFFMLHKSGELTKLDEQIIAQGNPLPPLKELEDRAAMNENTVIDEAAEDHTPAAVVLGSVADANIYSQQQKKFPEKVYKTPIKNISGRSDESTISTRSFVFPVFTGTTETERFSSKNGEQNNVELQAQPVKKQSTGELQSPSPVTPQGASRRRWFSWFFCCGCS